MFGLGWSEIFVAGVVGLLLFGGNLPKVAAEAARWVVGLKRSLNDIRRETGIEREIENARREVEASVEQSVKVREVQQKLTETLARPFREAAEEVRKPAELPPTSPTVAPPDVTAPTPKPTLGRDEASG
jgi:Sec-independent protein translocase protein TatA